MDRDAGLLQFLQGGGELGALIRAKDWSTTPLGPSDTWPQSLKTTLGIVLNSRYPMFVFWGQQLIKVCATRTVSIGIPRPAGCGPATTARTRSAQTFHPMRSTSWRPASITASLFLSAAIGRTLSRAKKLYGPR